MAAKAGVSRENRVAILIENVTRQIRGSNLFNRIKVTTLKLILLLPSKSLNEPWVSDELPQMRGYQSLVFSQQRYRACSSSSLTILDIPLSSEKSSRTENFLGYRRSSRMRIPPRRVAKSCECHQDNGAREQRRLLSRTSSGLYRAPAKVVHSPEGSHGKARGRNDGITMN